jgi:hypothetical protein
MFPKAKANGFSRSEIWRGSIVVRANFPARRRAFSLYLGSFGANRSWFAFKPSKPNPRKPNLFSPYVGHGKSRLIRLKSDSKYKSHETRPGGRSSIYVNYR